MLVLGRVLSTTAFVCALCEFMFVERLVSRTKDTALLVVFDQSIDIQLKHEGGTLSPLYVHLLHSLGMFG